MELNIKMLEVNIKGNSGCSMSILNSNNKYFIRKQTNDFHYIDRLKKQADKQKNFINNDIDFLVPAVFNEYLDEYIYFFDMEYFQSLDMISYLENINIDELDIFIVKLFQFIENLLLQCELKKVQKNIFIDKLNEIKSRIDDTFFLRYIIKIINYIKNDVNDIFLPIGTCHGDLTFSNILVQNDKLILIDFLDSFIETPLQDIVKLRQDTKHFWSLNLYEKKYDKTKSKIIMEYIDEKINSYFKKYDFYTHYYYLMQTINLLRIVPYAKDEIIIKYLKNELIELNGGNNE